MQNIKVNYLLIAIIFKLIFLSGCGNIKNYNSNEFDPIEPFNRKVFIFNKVADDIIFKPTIKAYNNSTPQFVKNIVDNFCANLSVIPTITNNILQGNLITAGNNSIRFVLNSSVGCFGMFDISSNLNLKKENEISFSNTLIYYGYNTPFYFILPILGPSTMSNLVTFIPDYFFDPQSILSKKYKKQLFWSILFNKKIQLLQKQVLMDMSSSSIDEYAFVRNAYLQYNKFSIYY
jgi:phospholipid-binding lipoprotein MlaA